MEDCRKGYEKKEVGERWNFCLAKRDDQKSEWLTGSNTTEKSG